MRKIIGIISFIFLIIGILLQLPAQGQSKKYFVITGKIMPENEGTGNGTIEILKNGKETSKIDIPKNGRFRFELEFFNEYSLTFKYPEHFNKIIQVSTEIPEDVWKRDNDFPPFPMIVQLTKEFEGVDKSFTLKPSGRIFYGKDIDNFEKESFINELQFTEQSETARTQNSSVAKEVATINKVNSQDLVAKQKEFDQLVKEADSHYQKGEYQMALIKYLDARKLFPDKAYPNDRVAELQDLVKALEMSEKQKAELEQKYKIAISKANAFFDQKSYKEARPVYDEAIQYKPGDVFATGRINEIDQLLALLEKQNQFKKIVSNADNEYKSKKYEAAINLYTQAKTLIPEDRYPQSQIDRINQELLQQSKLDQLDKDFNQNMQAGNTFAGQKDYMLALNAYKKAIGLKPDNQIAKDKIAEMEQAMVLAENDKKYIQAIQLADQALAKSDLTTAKTQYQEALKIKQDNYPKTKLAEILAIEAKEAEFNNLVAKGEKDFTDSKLDEALTSFSNALKIKPQDSNLKKRIDDVQNAKNKDLAEKEYTQRIAQADQNYKDNQFNQAIEAYKKAIDIKKNEAYPKDQLKKIDGYQALMKKAEKSFVVKDYQGALETYNEILVLKPQDSYASSKITEIQNILAELKQQDEKAKAEQLAYDKLIKTADQLLTDKNYNESVNKYKEALAIKSSETYPQKKIKEIETILDGIEKEKARIEAEYKATIAAGDDLLEKKDYFNSQSSYRKALAIKANEAYPKDQIQKIDQILADVRLREAEALKQQQEKLDNTFNEAMTAGDKAFSLNNFENAKSSYQTALSLKPNDTLAKKRLGETEAMIARITRNTIAYNKAITEANNHLSAKKYAEAKEKYVEASQYLPNEEYPKHQITKIDELLAQQAAELKLRQDFDKAFAEGESLLKSKDLINAKLAFTKATNLIPSEPIPPQRLNEIKNLMDEQERKEAALKATLEAYQKAVQKADNFFANKDYNPAQMAYSEALVIKPSEKYPQDQLRLIDKLLKELSDKNYQDAIAKGDNAFNSNQFEVSISSFQDALKIRKDDKYATQRLDDIEKKKADLEAENNRLKRIDSDYAALIDDANKDFNNRSYQVAKEKYQKALTLKSAEIYPKDQITKIDGILGQLKQAEEVNKAYAQLITQAENQFKINKLKESRELFQKANNLKPQESLPPLRIAEIDNLIAKQNELAQLAAQEEAQRKAKEKADKETYTRAIAAADKNFNAKQYKLAKVDYNEALIALPNEKYPKDQISKCDDLLAQEAIEYMALKQKVQNDSIQKEKNRLFDLAMTTAKNMAQNNQFEQAILKYKEAIDIKPDQRVKVQKLIDEINSKIQLLAKQDAEYIRILKLADGHFTEARLAEALTEYQNALKVKPAEEYPSNQIREIQNQLAAREQKYADAINNGDRAFNASEWVAAKTGYTEALSVKPNEVYPTNRLKEVNQKIADANLAASSKAAEDKAYTEAIDQAEKAFKDDQLSTARLKFQEAQTIKPSEEMPPRRIKEIDTLLDQRNKDRLALQQREIDEKYNQAIVLADNSYKEKTYNIAKLQYQQASLIKPDEQYPKTQIALMDKLMNEAKAQEIYLAKLPEKVENKPVINTDESAKATEARALDFAVTNDYGDVIKKADESFGIKDYAVARFYYYKASDIKPSEVYPKNQIELIRKLIDSQMSSGDVLEYDKAISQADASFSNKNYTIAKFYYYKALSIKSWEKYPKDRITEILALTNSLLSEKEEQEYKDIIGKADEAYFNKEIAIARFYYNKALSIKKDEQYPQIKLKDIQNLINQDANDKQKELYRSYIELGDQAMQSGNYTIARFNYNKALTINPEEKYPKDQIRLIKETIEKKKN